MRSQDKEKSPIQDFGIRVDCLQVSFLVYYLATGGELLFNYEQRMAIIKNKEKDYLAKKIGKLDGIY